MMNLMINWLNDWLNHWFHIFSGRQLIQNRLRNQRSSACMSCHVAHLLRFKSSYSTLFIIWWAFISISIIINFIYWENISFLPCQAGVGCLSQGKLNNHPFVTLYKSSLDQYWISHYQVMSIHGYCQCLLKRVFGDLQPITSCPASIFFTKHISGLRTAFWPRYALPSETAWH